MKTPKTPDLELVQAYLELNDQNAFEQIYLRYRSNVYRATSRALAGFSSAEVDEFAQELWARGPALFEPWDIERGTLRTYLVVQATWGARSAEAKRMRRHASRRAAELPASGQDPGASRCMSAWSLDNADGAEGALSGDGARKANASQAIRAYLDSANEDRPAYVLRQWLDGRTGREIAADLGVHPAQISRDLARARTKMQEFLPERSLPIRKGARIRS
ncbi:MAG: RNA polymerase sigma factor (sigma-70 family) [Cognaticolwellia sp.]|jgi:RNA polymerase sigma factor (sigma-70 family)